MAFPPFAHNWPKAKERDLSVKLHQTSDLPKRSEIRLRTTVQSLAGRPKVASRTPSKPGRIADCGMKSRYEKALKAAMRRTVLQNNDCHGKRNRLARLHLQAAPKSGVTRPLCTFVRAMLLPTSDKQDDARRNNDGCRHAGRSADKKIVFRGALPGQRLRDSD